MAFGIWHGYIPHPPRHRDATCTACSYGGPAPAGPYGRALVSDSVFGPPSAASPITTSDCTRRRYAGRGTQHHSTNMAVTSPVQTFNLAPSSNQHYLRSKACRPGVPINWFCICLTGAPLVPTPCLKYRRRLTSQYGPSPFGLPGGHPGTCRCHSRRCSNSGHSPGLIRSLHRCRGRRRSNSRCPPDLVRSPRRRRSRRCSNSRHPPDLAYSFVSASSCLFPSPPCRRADSCP